RGRPDEASPTWCQVRFTGGLGKAPDGPDAYRLNGGGQILTITDGWEMESGSVTSRHCPCRADQNPSPLWSASLAAPPRRALRMAVRAASVPLEAGAGLGSRAGGTNLLRRFTPKAARRVYGGNSPPDSPSSLEVAGTSQTTSKRLQVVGKKHRSCTGRTSPRSGH